MFIFCLNLQANEVVGGGAPFSTLNRKVVVIAPAYEDMEQLEEMLAGHGAKIMRGFIAKIIYPHITCKEVLTIDESDNAFTVAVHKNSITIYYTNANMREKAFKAFGLLFESPYGQKIVSGKYVEEILPSSGFKATKQSVKKSSGSGIVDGVTSVLSPGVVQSAIRQVGGGDFIMAVVSKRIFRFNFNVFNNWGANSKGIAHDGAYSTAQIVQLVKYASDNGVNFVPAIDLISPNAVFEQYTGHKMNSVEGMRFVRAIIEQCAREWRVDKICIGRKSSPIDCRYLEFLRSVAQRENIELVIL